MSYDPAFYDMINQGSLKSARTIVPELSYLIQDKSVLDLGCGEGAWLSVFRESGWSIRGVDGDYIDRSRLLIPEDYFTPFDLGGKGDFDAGARFGLAMSLEVAEHLPERRGRWLVETLCSHAAIVLFSAAIPGQGGVGHVNEQWQDYWVDLFDQQGFSCSSAFKYQFWNDAPAEVENWYAQNMLICVQRELLESLLSIDPMCELFRQQTTHLHRVVHPVLWESRL